MFTTLRNETLNRAAGDDRTQRSEPLAAIAWLSKSDFARARLRSNGFSLCRQYADFVMERDARQLTLGMAGVAVPVQEVALWAFESWTRLTGAGFDLTSLDAFAAHWRWRMGRPSAAARGWLGDPDAGERGAVEVADVQWIVFRPEPFLRWCEQATGSIAFAAASLDVYATHVVECCLPSKGRVLRSLAISA